MNRQDSAAISAARSFVAALAVLAGCIWPVTLGAQSTPPAAPPVPAGSVGGLGDINLFPKRVVLDSRTRVVSIGLFNKTANTGDYDIKISDRMMTEDGQLVDLASVADPAIKARVMTASAFLRWSPRKVTLRGNESQTVRVMARITPDLPPGEYRSHFQAIAIPPGTEGGTSIEQAKGQPVSGIAVRITPRFGISIPVIVRVGATTLTAGLKDLRLATSADGEPALRFTITRAGNRSAFGNISITAPGAKKPLVELKGIGVYPEIAERHVVAEIDPTALNAPLRPGTKLTVSYIDDDFAPGKTLARQEFIVP